jgi:hypothetical protein
MSSSNRTEYRSRRFPCDSRVIICIAIVAAVIWGGYVKQISWLGINGRTATLWDWLNLLVLPCAFATVPILARREERRRLPTIRSVAMTAAAAGIFIALSYMLRLRWTGFSGNKLWDWLHLLLPPLAVASLPLLPKHRPAPTRRQTAAGVSTIAAAALIAIGGYRWGWNWTGFQGNTLWDWFNLLLLPIAVPVLLRPAVHAFAISWTQHPTGQRELQERGSADNNVVMLNTRVRVAQAGSRSDRGTYSRPD